MTDTSNQPINQDQPTADEQRPAWLPEKFSSPEQMAEAYAFLEEKMGQPGTQHQPQQEAPQAPINQPQEPDLSAFYEEFVQNGALSEASYQSLAQQGYGRNLVDNHLAGQRALADQYTQEIYRLAGGEQQFNALKEWAQSNITDQEKAMFDAAIDAGDMAAIRQSVLAMKQQFDQSNPNRLNGSLNQPAVAPFASSMAMVKAMQDERYDYDPDYREEIKRRIAASQFEQ